MNALRQKTEEGAYNLVVGPTLLARMKCRGLGYFSVLLVCSLSCGAGAKPDADHANVSSLQDTSTLYMQLGGIDVIRNLVDEWMLEISTDERVRDFFIPVEIGKLKLRMVEQLCVQMKGPCLYQGRELYAVHAGLDIGESQLRAFLENLERAMSRTEIPVALRAKVKGIVRSLAPEIKNAAGL